MRDDTVMMMCLTTKQKFEAVNPPVVVLNNGRFAFREMCPWKGKNGRDLYAFKFCSKRDYESYYERTHPYQSDEEDSEDTVV